MFNDSHRKFYILGISSVAVGTVFFLYQNIFYEKHKLSKQATIYVAKEDIPLNTELTKDMFEEVQIPKVALVGNTVEDFTQVEGVFSKFTIAEGSVLVSSQLTGEKVNKEGEFTVPLQGNFSSDIDVDDDVAIFVLLDSQGKKEVKKLFSSKRIYGEKFITGDAIAGEDSEITYYIKVTQYELQAYFEAVAQGQIIIAKRLYEYSPSTNYSNNFTGQFEASSDNLLEHFEPNWKLEDESTSNQSGSNSTTNSTIGSSSSSNSITSSNTSQSTPLGGSSTGGSTSDSDVKGTMIYTTSSSDSWEIISAKFKTDVTTLKTLNPSVTSIKEGLVLTVPAI